MGAYDLTLQEKLDDLKRYIQSLGSVAVAFSGGVDSALLVKVASETLGGNTIAITARPPDAEAPGQEEARRHCKDLGVPHVFVLLDEPEATCAMSAEERCYDCKSPERICRGLSVLWTKPGAEECEVVLIGEELGY